MDSIWKASGNGQLLPSGTLLTFNPPPTDVPQGRFAVRITFKNKDQSLFPIGAQGAPTAQCPWGGNAAWAGAFRKCEACLRPEASDSAIMMATTEPPWLVTPEKVHTVVGRLIEMAHPKRIILFGSYARGKITEGSDLDVLIVA